MKICDRSPCDPLLRALGVYIFGTKNGFVVNVEGGKELAITYCPFCGTRLGQVDIIQHARARKAISRGPAS